MPIAAAAAGSRLSRGSRGIGQTPSGPGFWTKEREAFVFVVGGRGVVREMGRIAHKRRAIGIEGFPPGGNVGKVRGKAS